ncbi:MAG: phosphohistidine phosphatase SixA, partial [Chloroflexi bacterium]
LTGANVSLKKGGLARVDVFSPSLEGCELVWLITPKIFDALEA